VVPLEELAWSRNAQEVRNTARWACAEMRAVFAWDASLQEAEGAAVAVEGKGLATIA
jgi:hypothetical protein